MSKVKIIIVHGNGGATYREAWLPWAQDQLERLGLEVINETFPDNVKARAQYWLPNLQRLGADAHTVIIGHSSGALAAMRYAEAHQILGSVLVCAAYTDLGEDSERISGYFDSAWDWQAIRTNQQWILQFGSPSDPYIPIKEQRQVQKFLHSTYHELAGRGHFMDNTFPELIKALQKALKL
jgi:predicted alpha/beta hydrolase family esterase